MRLCICDLVLLNFITHLLFTPICRIDWDLVVGIIQVFFQVFYCGKAGALGVKQAGIRTGKWSELVLTKAPKITHIAVGHDGLHAILLTEDGSVFFAGNYSCFPLLLLKITTVNVYS